MKLSSEQKLSIGPLVANALNEDIGSGDLTVSLVDAEAVVGASIIARQSLVLCGQAWVDEVFAQKTLAEWSEIFTAHDVWWQKVQTFEEVLEDPQAIAAGAFPSVDGLDYPLVSAPMSFGVTSQGYSAVITEAAEPALKSAPSLGEDNVAVMREIGLSEEQIEKLQAAGVLSTQTNDPKRL